MLNKFWAFYAKPKIANKQLQSHYNISKWTLDIIDISFSILATKPFLPLIIIVLLISELI